MKWLHGSLVLLQSECVRYYCIIFPVTKMSSPLMAMPSLCPDLVFCEAHVLEQVFRLVHKEWHLVLLVPQVSLTLHTLLTNGSRQLTQSLADHCTLSAVFTWLLGLLDATKRSYKTQVWSMAHFRFNIRGRSKKSRLLRLNLKFNANIRPTKTYHIPN